MKTYLKFGFLVLFAIGCTSTRITTSWKAPDVPPKNFQKIMVLGLIRDADRTIQENMENHFVGDLKAIGIEGVSSLQAFGPKALENLSEQEAVAKMKTSGVDAVITIVLLDKEKERKYYPGNFYYSPYGYYHNRFWGYRTVLYRRIYEPGYYVTDTRYFWESNLYDMENQKLLYSAQTQSFDPSSSATLGHQYSQMIVKDMVKNGVLRNPSTPTLKGF